MLSYYMNMSNSSIWKMPRQLLRVEYRDNLIERKSMSDRWWGGGRSKTKKRKLRNKRVGTVKRGPADHVGEGVWSWPFKFTKILSNLLPTNYHSSPTWDSWAHHHPPPPLYLPYTSPPPSYCTANHHGRVFPLLHSQGTLLLLHLITIH